MYNKTQLRQQLEMMGIRGNDTLLVHSSMKSIGSVDGGADTVLDVLSEYMQDGLLIFPTHTWKQIPEEKELFDPKTEPSCVGLLSDMFWKRPGVCRSLHPTHSVAAKGREAEEYCSGEEKMETPCARDGCWGKLYDRHAKILFLGCSLNKNTFLHGVEEWNGISNRLAGTPRNLAVARPDGTVFPITYYGHFSTVGDVSAHYGKLEPNFTANRAAVTGSFGDARCVVCEAVPMADLVTSYLKRNPGLFDNNEPF